MFAGYVQELCSYLHLKGVDELEGVLGGAEDLVPPVPTRVQLQERLHPQGQVSLFCLADSVTRLRPDEIPEKIMKFPHSFPANLDFPNFCFENSQNMFYCIFINKYYPPQH